jgi:hypothetical protein
MRCSECRLKELAKKRLVGSSGLHIRRHSLIISYPWTVSQASLIRLTTAGLFGRGRRSNLRHVTIGSVGSSNESSLCTLNLYYSKTPSLSKRNVASFHSLLDSR